MLSYHQHEVVTRFGFPWATLAEVVQACMLAYLYSQRIRLEDAETYKNMIVAALPLPSDNKHCIIFYLYPCALQQTLL